MRQSKHNALVAYLKRVKDLKRALDKKTYHIPKSSAPQIVRDKTLKYIAFYQPKIFGEERKYKIEFFGEVEKITEHLRKEILPEVHPNANKPYYQIHLKNIQELPNKIVSKRPRRNPFIPTTFQKLTLAKEYNEVVAGTPIEEIMWKRFLEEKIDAEREYMEYVSSYQKRFLYLDFAIFCKNGKIDVECDGDTYHSSKEAVKNDKHKRNILESKGWHVLQFPTEKIYKQLDECIDLVKDVAVRYGGIKSPDSSEPKLFYKTKGGQLGLFD